jgi:hypothetical protein
METNSATITLSSGLQIAEHLEPGWFPMRDAPRDGTIIECRVKFGIKPSFHKFAWRDDGPSGPRWSDSVPGGSGMEMYVDDMPYARMGAGTSNMMWRPL